MPALSPSPADDRGPVQHPHDHDALSVAFEARLTREERRRRGVFNTPMAVARDAVDALIVRPGTVCDPSCGTGTFLLAAGERLVTLGLTRREAAACLTGVDVDPAAVAVARERLSSWAGGAAANIDVGDGLAVADRFDFVVGNPPYVDRLHARFLAHATVIGGAVAMVVPTSVLATDDGRAARASGLGVESMVRLGPVFDAEVDTCVLVLRRGAPVPPGPTWSALLVEGDAGLDPVPVCDLDGAPLSSSCDVVAGFRQHYYGLRGHVHEGGGGLPLVTSGAIDLGEWGRRSVRFDKRRYLEPRVDLDGVGEPVRSWFRSLLRPKVVVATQTRVIEAAPDPDGVVVPSVPVISVVPRDPARLWLLLAVLLAPPVTAWAFRRWGGTALTPGALKLGAPQVREIPEPLGMAAWASAADVLRDAGPGGVVEAGALMCSAYGAGEEVHAWWAARLR
ncbi:MAG TPA: N-6 DNA methylase [Acidimicrobiales bacterium]|nr:N-6 DNA methylase [Acidimicrobiales bacterium]